MLETDSIVVVATLHVIAGFFGFHLGDRKNACWMGMLLGLIFGGVGLVVAVPIDNRDPCPLGAIRLGRGAKICPECGTHIRGGEIDSRDTPPNGLDE